MNTRRILLLLLACAAVALSQNKPDYSGTWKLTAEESKFSDKRTRAPDRLTWTIRQVKNHVYYKVASERDGKKNGFEADAEIGGEPFESDAAGIIRFQWKGASLAVDTLYNPGQDRQSSVEEIWTLSADGKKLTDEVVYHMPKTAKDPSDVHFTRVFDKP
jgi:hypothetical protein